MERITEGMLDRQIDRINDLTGNAKAPYSKVDGKLIPNVGNYHLSISLGSFKLEQMARGGGVHSILYGSTKRGLYDQVRAFIYGLQEKLEEKKELEQQVEDLESELASLKDFTQNQGWLHKGLRELREGREQGNDPL